MKTILSPEEKKINIKNKRLFSCYGITYSDWVAMLDDQEGHCKMCPRTTSLCVDHRHVKNYKNLSPERKKQEVRALLCYPCNRHLVGPVERYFLFPRRSAAALVKYLNEHKTKEDL